MVANKASEAIAISQSASKLPSRLRARDGGTFDANLDVWSFRTAKGRIHIDFGRVSANASIALVDGLKSTIAWFAANRADDTCSGAFGRMVHFLSYCHASTGNVVDSVSSELVLSYRASLAPEKQWYLSVLSGVLKKWHSLGYPGIDRDVPNLLSELRLKGNAKGTAVATLDPEEGPFSDIELEAIQSAVNAAYADGSLTLREYVLVWLFMLIGPRPSQLALLKIRDFRIEKLADGTATYQLRVPRLKQRHITARTSFKERIIAPQIGALIAAYVTQLLRDLTNSEEANYDAPLFPAVRTRHQLPDGYEGHSVGTDLGRQIQSAIDRLVIVSERTGLSLNVTMTRFRRTLGTRAAMEGHGELVIAELLDHSDTQNVGVYVESRPEIVDRIDKAIALKLAPLAQAFAGLLVMDEADAERGDDPTSRIVDPGIAPSMQPMGTCGKHGFCGLSAPIACYTCRSFQPWVDGPHEAVLDHLLAQRERLAATTDLRVASINDRSILAVAEVMRQCAQFRGETGGVANG
jgi:integrase